RRATTQQYALSYRLTIPRPASHLFEVTIIFVLPANDSAGFIDLQMPKWQPGRYSIADFAANVQEFSARSQDRTLAWTKIDDQTWRGQRPGSPNITARTKVFGEDMSGTLPPTATAR